MTALEDLNFSRNLQIVITVDPAVKTLQLFKNYDVIPDSLLNHLRYHALKAYVNRDANTAAFEQGAKTHEFCSTWTPEHLNCKSTF